MGHSATAVQAAQELVLKTLITVADSLESVRMRLISGIIHLLSLARLVKMLLLKLFIVSILILTIVTKVRHHHWKATRC